jgi:hypothetical protein
MSFKYIDLLNEDYVYQIPKGTIFSVKEVKSAGAGACNFTSESAVLFIKAKDSAPIVWALKNRKCAEAAFLTIDDEGKCHLHIVEMKSSLSSGDFRKVIEQWRGMYLSALAVLGVIKMDHPVQVRAYIAFRNDRVAQIDPTQLVLTKTLVGGERMPALQEWATGKVDLYHGVSASIIKGLRLPDDVDFGMV